MTRRLTRLAAAAVAGGALAALIGLGAAPAQATASPGFTCATGLQEACAIVFAPLCRKGCY